jgi:hypothetical protein
MITTNLDMTLALLDTSSRAKVATRRIRWDSMAQVLQILRRSFKETPDFPLSERELEISKFAWIWASVCMDGPVAPDHPSTGVTRLLTLISEGDTELNLPKLKRLHQSVVQVISGNHPAAEVIASTISNKMSDDGIANAGITHPHVLVLRGDGLAGVQEWCTLMNLPVDVVTMSQARQSRPWPGLAFIFGPPERYTSSAWVQGPEAAATAGWLLTAPPAPSVQVISWTGHRPLIKDGYQPWLGAPNPDVEGSEPDILVEDDFLPEFMDAFTPVAAPGFETDGDDSETAYGLQFQVNGDTVLAYFSSDVGPKPTIVTFSEDEVLVTHVPLRSIRLGNCLILRTSSAGKDALDTATREWFKEHRDGSTPDSAIGHQQQFKKAIRQYLTTHTRGDLVAALENEGVPRDYARSLASRALLPEFIAPQKESIYDKVCLAINLDKPKEAFRHLKYLRTGRRQAGLILSARIAERLEEMPDLPDRLRDHGAVILTQPGVEGVALLVVRSISNDPVDVPTWRLGQALRKEGHTWSP